MRRRLLLLLLMMGTLSIHANDYTYLTFETTDGAKVSVSATSLTLVINGTTLTVGNQSFTLTNLSKMYFSTSDETTGIDQIENGELIIENSATAIYDLQGRKVSKNQMRSGQVYIVKTTSGTHKVAVK